MWGGWPWRTAERGHELIVWCFHLFKDKPAISVTFVVKGVWLKQKMCFQITKYQKVIVQNPNIEKHSKSENCLFYLNKGRWALFRCTWWRHQMEISSALLTLFAGNSPVPGEIPAQSPVTRSFDVFFDLHLNKRLSKHSWCWWFETPSIRCMPPSFYLWSGRVTVILFDLHGTNASSLSVHLIPEGVVVSFCNINEICLKSTLMTRSDPTPILAFYSWFQKPRCIGVFFGITHLLSLPWDRITRLTFQVWESILNIYKADSRFAPGQWETSLQSNAVSHWLGANLKLALIYMLILFGETYICTSYHSLNWKATRCSWVSLLTWRKTKISLFRLKMRRMLSWDLFIMLQTWMESRFAWLRVVCPVVAKMRVSPLLSDPDRALANFRWQMLRNWYK